MSELSKQAFKGNFKEVKRIVESGEYLLDDLWAVSCAIKSGKIETVKFLVETGLPIQRYALNQAVNSGKLPIVKFFFEKGHALEEEDLDDAISNEYLDIANYLLDNNVPISAFAVDNAVSAANINLVSRLIDKGAKTDNYAISQAIVNDDIPMIELLISKGKKIRKSHLLEAIAGGNMKMIVFITAGVEEHIGRNAFDQSVLQAVLDTNRLGLIMFFIKNIGLELCEDNISNAISNDSSYEIIEFLIESLKKQENGSCCSDYELSIGSESDSDSEDSKGSESGSK
jgi:hypothetical protein